MKQNDTPAREVGKKSRLAFALILTLCAAAWAFQLWRALEYGTASNAPGWGMYALLTALSALAAVAWLVSWLRYDRTHREKHE